MFTSIQDEVIESYSEDYSLFDISIIKNFANNKLKCVLGVKNLFNVEDIKMNSLSSVHSAYQSTQSVSYGTSYFISLRLSL